MTNAETIFAIRALRLLGQAEELERQILQREASLDYSEHRDDVLTPSLLLGFESSVTPQSQ